MQLEFLKFRGLEPGDAKEYKNALNETLDDLRLYKSTLVENPQISAKKTELAIRANQFFQKPNEDYFVLMNGKHLVAYGYAVQRPDDEWSELGLWVRKSYQGKGCGVHMLRLLAGSNSPSRLYGTVRSIHCSICNMTRAHADH